MLMFVKALKPELHTTNYHSGHAKKHELFWLSIVLDVLYNPPRPLNKTDEIC